METTNIYILIDPLTGFVRYVGKANNIAQRYKAHNNKARKHTSHKVNWIKSLKTKGVKPIIEVIDTVPIDEWQFWETYWISQFRSWGFDLINYTSGGDGCSFQNQTSFKKGHKPWNYGTRKLKILKGNQGKSENSVKNYFKKDYIPWNKGIKGYTIGKKRNPVSEDTKNKIRLSLLGKESKKKRKIKQFDMNKNLIKEFSSITEAKLLTGIKGINNVLTGRAKTAGGYLWE